MSLRFPAIACSLPPKSVLRLPQSSTTLKRYGRFGIYGAGAQSNQPNGPPRPLAQRGLQGFAMCCAGLGLAADVGGPGCCPFRNRCSSTYQGRPPRFSRIAGSTRGPCGGITKYFVE